MGLTSEIGRFIADMRFERVPADAIGTVRTGFSDCIAVMVAGSTEPVLSVAARGLGLDIGSANLPLSGIKAAPPDRALIYGVAAHALDYDDTALSGHPSAVLVPAILSEAAETGADGRAMIAAYVTGYEVWAELIRRDPDQHHGKGWHPSAMFGVIAATAASASLRKHDAAQASRAIGIAASLASGIVGNFGSMTKSFQVGRAAQSGLQATRLAEAGLTSSPEAIEDDLGFLRAISPKDAVDTKSPSAFGATWAILQHGINIKLYPVCYAIHRAIDAAIDLRLAEKLDACDIDAVDVEIGETQAQILRIHRPVNALDAKISGEFAMTAAVIAGRVGRAELTDDFVMRADVQNFLPKVSFRTIAEKDPDEPAHSPSDRVSLTLRDGRVVQSDWVKRPRGHFQYPVDNDGLWRKFEDCASGLLGNSHARRLFDSIQRLEHLPSLAEFGLFTAPTRRLN